MIYYPPDPMGSVSEEGKAKRNKKIWGTTKQQGREFRFLGVNIWMGMGLGHDDQFQLSDKH